MQFRKLFFSLCCMVALGVSLAACSEDEELFDDSGSKVTLPVHRAFILNEGTQGANNATLSFYAPDGNADFIKDIFYIQNQAKLGDTGQALIEYNNDLYAIISGSRYLIRMNTAGVNHQWNMIIRFRQFTFGVSHQFAMIPFQYEYRIIKPGLFTRLFKELTQSPIRILNDLRLRFTCFRMEERRYHIRRMITDGQ